VDNFYGEEVLVFVFLLSRGGGEKIGGVGGGGGGGGRAYSTYGGEER